MTTSEKTAEFPISTGRHRGIPLASSNRGKTTPFNDSPIYLEGKKGNVEIGNRFFIQRFHGRKSLFLLPTLSTP